MVDKTTVDILSLEDFLNTLSARHAEASALVSAINTDLCVAPELGGFTHGAEQTKFYGYQRYGEIMDRAERIKKAIEVTQQATQSILANYRTTEERNAANATDISAMLGGIDIALGAAVGAALGGISAAGGSENV